MKSIRMLFPIFGLLVAVASAGCSGESGAAGGAESASGSTQAQNEVVSTTSDGGGHEGHHGGAHGHGPGGGSLVFAALHEPINLSAAQRTNIEAIVAANKPPSRPAPDPARIAALAAAIRANDVASLAPTAPDANEVAEHQAHVAAEAKALATLHGTLSKDQRAALVSAVLAKMDKGPGEHGHDHDGKGPPPDGAGRGPHGKGPMGGLLEGLNLTAQQEATIKAKFEAQKPSDADKAAHKAKFEAMKAEREAKLKTFADDNFDATAFVTPPANDGAAGSDKGGPGMHGPRNELAIIVPVLDATQREALAKKIEAGPPAHEGRGPQNGPPQD